MMQQPTLNYFSEEQAIINEYNRMALLRDDEAQDPYLITIIDPEIEAMLEPVEEGTEADSYGLEGKYKEEFEEWKDNYYWYGKTFQEWTRDYAQYCLDSVWYFESFQEWIEDKKDYNKQVNWYDQPFMEWVQSKREYEEKMDCEMRENWEDDMSDDGGKYWCRD